MRMLAKAVKDDLPFLLLNMYRSNAHGKALGLNNGECTNRRVLTDVNCLTRLPSTLQYTAFGIAQDGARCQSVSQVNFLQVICGRLSLSDGELGPFFHESCHYAVLED